MWYYSHAELVSASQGNPKQVQDDTKGDKKETRKQVQGDKMERGNYKIGKGEPGTGSG